MGTFLLFEIIVITHQFCVPLVLMLIVLAGFLFSNFSFVFAFGLILCAAVLGQATCFLMIQSLAKIVNLDKKFKCIRIWKKKLKFKKKTKKTKTEKYTKNTKNNSTFWSYFLFLKLTSF